MGMLYMYYKQMYNYEQSLISREKSNYFDKCVDFLIN